MAGVHGAHIQPLKIASDLRTLMARTAHLHRRQHLLGGLLQISSAVQALRERAHQCSGPSLVSSSSRIFSAT